MKWAKRHMGGIRHFHDHFTIPSSELTPETAAYRAAYPQVKEMLQRYMLSYHISPEMYAEQQDANLMGHAIEEAVYAPLYYGYGEKDGQAPFRSPEGQCTQMGRGMEERILERAPDTVLVLLKADPEVIRQRMRNNPDPTEGEPTRGVVQDEGAEYVLARFEEEFEQSLIRNKIILDTTAATAEETLTEFLEKHEPYLTQSDLRRMKRPVS